MKQDETRACFRTIIGGQALIEGILMRGPDKSCIVVRKEDGTLTEARIDESVRRVLALKVFLNEK